MFELEILRSKNSEPRMGHGVGVLVLLPAQGPNKERPGPQP